MHLQKCECYLLVLHIYGLRSNTSCWIKLVCINQKRIFQNSGNDQMHRLAAFVQHERNLLYCTSVLIQTKRVWIYDVIDNLETYVVAKMLPIFEITD